MIDAGKKSMPHDRPYHRNVRALIDGPGRNVGYSTWAYIEDPEYAPNGHHSIRAFMLLQEDLGRILEFIEPSDRCVDAYSFRIHELLMRVCIEI